MRSSLKPFRCPCTNRMTYSCDCSGQPDKDYTQESHNLKSLIRISKLILVMAALVVAAFVLGTLSGCTQGVVNDTVTRPPAMGPNHAGPNMWNRADSEKRQAFCYAEVLKFVRASGIAQDNNLPFIKSLWFDCMKQNGGVI